MIFAGRPAGHGLPFGATAAGLYALYAAQLWWMFRRIGNFGPVTALLFPFPLAFFHAVFARSVWLVKVRGSVTWRGRQIKLPPSARPTPWGATSGAGYGRFPETDDTITSKERGEACRQKGRTRAPFHSRH